MSERVEAHAGGGRRAWQSSSRSRGGEEQDHCDRGQRFDSGEVVDGADGSPERGGGLLPWTTLL